MRARIYLLLALLSWPAVAAAAPGVKELINGAIKAIQGTSYEAKMKFMSHLDNGEVRQVRMYHVAPDLYHVDLLDDNGITGEFFVENASELLLVGNGQPPLRMSQRQFAINDAMTVKFLRDLGDYPGISVLDGQVGDQAVYVLRKGVTHDKPYEVTVGVDRKTSFPLFLLVNDAQGAARVYYEMQSIQFRQPEQLADSLFTVNGEQQRLPMAPAPFRPELEAEKGAAAKPAAPLPLYPAWLPKYYRVEAVSVLSCPHGGKHGDCAPVYHFEAYGPELDDLVSIFQMQAGKDAKASIERLRLAPDTPFYVTTSGEWVVAVFGDLDQKQLQHIASSLAPNADTVRGLLEQTLQRDGILDDVFSSAR